jgi:hypothetical protein
LITYREEGSFTLLEKWSGGSLVGAQKLSWFWNPTLLPDQRLLLVLRGSSASNVAVIDQNFHLATTARIVARQLYYENSYFSNYPNFENKAIATDKVPYFSESGVPARSYSHISSYSRGINGLMIDMLGPHGQISLDDFVFRVGNSADPSSWTLAPSPSSFYVSSVSGMQGADRVQFSWPDGAIKNTWLQIEVRANSDTNLSGENSVAERFYFGNLVGETGDAAGRNFIVNASDALKTRNSIGLKLPVTAVGDHNRDGMINSADLVLARMPAGFLGLVALPAVVPPVANSFAIALSDADVAPSTPWLPSNSSSLVDLMGSGLYAIGTNARPEELRSDPTTTPQPSAQLEDIAAAARLKLLEKLPLHLALVRDPVASLDLDFVESLALESASEPGAYDPDEDERWTGSSRLAGFAALAFDRALLATSLR